jgi:hypothetical protein
MLFMAKRVAGLATIPAEESLPLCAIAPALDSARAVANVIVETLIVNFSLWSVDDSNHTDSLGCVAGNQIVRIDGDTDDLAQRGTRSIKLVVHGWPRTARPATGRVLTARMVSARGSHRDSRDLRILKIGPKEQSFGSGYTTAIRRCAMPCAAHATNGVIATAFAGSKKPSVQHPSRRSPSGCAATRSNL